MWFPAIRSRWDALVLTRRLHKSLVEPKDRWTVSSDDGKDAVLTHGDFRIVLLPRGPRLLDVIHLYRKDAEIWLPLIPRLQLRAAARLRLLQDANKVTEPGKAHQGNRSRRRRARTSS
jgi:hypothetical protein